jgi:hypothetical protein
MGRVATGAVATGTYSPFDGSAMLIHWSVPSAQSRMQWMAADAADAADDAPRAAMIAAQHSTAQQHRSVRFASGGKWRLAWGAPRASKWEPSGFKREQGF